MNKVRHTFHVVGRFFKRNLRFFGLPLVYLGIGLLALLYILGMTNHNLLLLPTLLIPVGIYCYIREEKQQDKY
jgi:hypothetical protein